MEKVLSEDAAERFNADGFVFPVRVLSREEAAETVRAVERIKAANAHLSREDHDHKLFRSKPHLIFTWLDRIVHQPRILDAVEHLIGPDILVWTSSVFIKEPRDPAYFGWHQDSYTYPLDGDEVINVWVALTDATRENGAMRFHVGSNRLGPLGHVETWDEYHLGSRGETVDIEVNEDRVVDVLLDAGEASLHHVNLLHSSEPNRSDGRRIGYAIRYIPSHIRDKNRRGTAMLVRGHDRFGHWDPEPRPNTDYDPNVMPVYHRAMAIRSETSFEGTATDRAYTEA